MLIKKRYYIIYRHKDNEVSQPFAIVTSKKVAEDWCKLNKDYYYIERICA